MLCINVQCFALTYFVTFCTIIQMLWFCVLSITFCFKVDEQSYCRSYASAYSLAYCHVSTFCAVLCYTQV